MAAQKKLGISDEFIQDGGAAVFDETTILQALKSWNLVVGIYSRKRTDPPCSSVLSMAPASLLLFFSFPARGTCCRVMCGI